METLDKELDFVRPPVDDDALQQLEEIRQEAEEASALDNEIDHIPDSAYDDARSLLTRLIHEFAKNFHNFIFYKSLCNLA